MAGSGSTSPCSSRVGSVRPQKRLPSTGCLPAPTPYRDFDAPTFTMAMKVGGTYLAGRVGTTQWRKVAAQLLLEEQDVLNCIHQLATDLPTAIAVAAEADPVRELRSTLPERLTDLVAARCRVLMAHLN